MNLSELFGKLLDVLESGRPQPIYKELEEGDWVRQGPCQIGGPDLFSVVLRRYPELDGPLGDDWYEFEPRIYVDAFTGEKKSADRRPFVQSRCLVTPVEGPPKVASRAP